jgi:hypothetical protein
MIEAKINKPNINTNGTSLQGYVTTTYSFLVDKLGEPISDNADKVTCYWDIEFKDGSVACIYDWKTESTPMESYDWHIGGKSPTIVEKIEDLLGIPTIGF